MAHAPVTSHSTYLSGSKDGLEDLEDYNEGGYHPIHLGDILDSEGRYRVVHKLGHGGFSTVWLCRDTREGRYVAVKVSIADVNAADMVDLVLEKLDKTAQGAEFIASTIHQFSLEGPNGTHKCLVLPLLGPRVSPGLWTKLDHHDSVLKTLCHQGTQAMEYLHSNNICHGDFRPANILMKLKNLDHLTEDDLLLLLGQPKKCGVLTKTGEPVPVSTPNYLVAPTNLSQLDQKYLTNQICVVDFGEAFLISSPPEELGVSHEYLPPELILEDDATTGPASDLWALGCTLFKIRQQMPLFYKLADADEQLAEMAGLLGKLPDHLWYKWTAKENYYDNDGNRTAEGEPEPIERFLGHKLEVQQGNGKKVLLMSEDEQKLLADLLRKLLCYEPEKRLSAREALEHEWLSDMKSGNEDEEH